MDVTALKGVKSLNNYKALTQDWAYKYKNVQMQCNMSTVLALKSVRSLEIEYFNKFDDSGAAIIVFERLLLLPPSKAWSILGKELVSLIGYWLQEVRKNLICHHPHWWSFVQRLLTFVKELIKKDHALHDMLVEHTAESFLDLATSSRLSTNQRHDVLYTFNIFCAESCKDIRFALWTKFEPYFIRLSIIMATCGHLPTQYSIMETLLRWLVPRRDPAVRRDVVSKWFPQHLYSRRSVEVFLDRNWDNFFQDTRDFLNAHNEMSDFVTSVVCRKLVVGDHVLVSGAGRRATWLDINVSANSVSVHLDPRPAGRGGAGEGGGVETLTVTSDSTIAAKLYRDSVDLTLLLTTSEPPQLLPAGGRHLGTGGQQVRIVISSRSDMARVDNALRAVFHDKYEVLLDFENMTPLSPMFTDLTIYNEDTRFSRSRIDARPLGQSGVIVRSGKPVSFKSPSTTSTTSLAQLRNKLTALPKYHYEHTRMRASVKPDLSVITDLSERSDSLSYFDNDADSTLKLTSIGVLNRNIRPEDAKKSLSDSDVTGKKSKYSTSHYSDTDKKSSCTNFNVFNNKDPTDRKIHGESIRKNAETIISKEKLNIQPVRNSPNAVITNDTFEQLSQFRDTSDDAIVNLLLQEALRYKNIADDECLRESGINTGDVNKSQDLVETIENTPNIQLNIPITDNRSSKVRKCTISKSTSNESNTEVISDTPISYVSMRKRNQRKISMLRRCEQSTEDAKIVPPFNDNTAFDVQSAEKIFAQHSNENKVDDIILSPTLVKKLNATSSENSVVSDCELHNIEIIECLNDIVDKICNDFDKYTREGLDSRDIAENRNDSKYKKLQRYSSKTKEKSKNKKVKGNLKLKRKQSIKKKITPVITLDVTKTNKKVTTKEQIRPTMTSPIIEVNNELSDMSIKYSSPQTPRTYEVDNKLIRRKRKLYSPKDDYVIPDNRNEIDAELINLSDNQDDIPLSEIKKTSSSYIPTITPYKKIENERYKYKRLRTIKSRSKADSPILSPKTKKNNFVFDKLKENIDTQVKITLADKTCDNDIAIYNLTSDSEDEDFKNKKIELQKRISTTTVDSGNSFIFTRLGRMRKVDYVESIDKVKIKTDVNRKRPMKRGNCKTNARKVNVNPIGELEDEKIRDAMPEKLNTSLVIENSKKNIKFEEPDPEILAPQVELVTEVNLNKKRNQAIMEKKKCPKKSGKPAKRKKAAKQVEAEHKFGDRTISPLPELVIESAPTIQKKADDSLSSNMLRKIKKLYQEGPDTVNDISITNTTHNLLSDAERANFSVHMNITDELNDVIGDDNIRHEDAIVDNEESSSSTKDNPKEALYKICDTKYVNSKLNVLKDSDKIGDNNLIADNKIIKNTCKKRTLQLNNKNQKTCKLPKISSEKDVISPEKSQTCPVKLKTKFQQKTCIEDSNESKKMLSRLTTNFIETIDISNTVAEMKSEKSISTIGINGHGDLSEEPPSLKTLNENFIPRELVDMNESTKHCYVMLMNDLLCDNKCENGPNESNTRVQGRKVISPEKRSDDISKRIPENKSEKSLKVTQETKSYDYSRWLPSSKNSDTEPSGGASVSKSANKSPVVCMNRLSDDIFKWVSVNDDNNSIEKCTNVTSNYIKNLEENEAGKYTTNTSPNSSCKRLATTDLRNSMSEASDSTKVSKSEKSPVVCIERFRNLSKFGINNESLEKCTNVASNNDKSHKEKQADSRNNTSSNDSIELRSMIYQRDPVSDASLSTKVSKKLPILCIEKIPDDVSKRNIHCSIYDIKPKGKEAGPGNETCPKDSSKRLSLISPMSFHSGEKTTRTKRKLEDDSSEDDTVKPTKNMSTNTYQSKVKTTPRKPYLQKNLPDIPSSSNRLDTSSICDKNTSSKGAKIRKLDDSNTRPLNSIDSCVEDWLKTQPACSKDQILIDTLHSGMEKLYTTNAEMNENSIKNLMDSFVGVIEENNKHRTNIVKMIEDEFEALNKNMAESFAVFIRDARAKQKDMRTMLWEDIVYHLNCRREL